MAERRTSVRLAVVGGSEVRAELMGIGADGQRSLEGIGRGAQSAGAGLRLLDGNASAARQQIANLRGQTGNLAAQFQDIGVQLAGGQSPFLIALQQGGQISQVLGPGGARGAVAALGAAFASLVNPVSLATIGIIAAGGAAFQYFSTLLGDGEKSTEELTAQADLVGRVAREWGDAVPALQAYVDELERAQSAAERTEAVEAGLEGLAQRNVERFHELYDSIRNVVALVPDAQREFGVLAGEVESGVATNEDFERVMRALAAAMGDQAVPEIERAIGVIATMRDETAATAAEMANLAAQATTAASRIGQVFTGGGSIAPVLGLIRGTEEWIAEQERLNGLTSEQITLESEIGRLRRDAKEAGAAVTDAEIERLARERIAAEQRRAAAARAAAGAAGRGGGGGNAELREANELNRDAERIIRSVMTATEEYNATLADLKRLLDAGAISQEVYGRATAEAEERLAAATAAEREAALATSGDPFEGARAGMQEYAAETLSTAEMIRDSVVDAFSAAEDAVGDFVRTGKLEVRSLVSSIIADMAQLMIRQRVLTPLANWLGGLGGGAAGGGLPGMAGAPAAASGRGGGFFSSLISGIGRIFGGGRASGGPVAAGVAYLVGERGTPELFVPDRAGQILPMETAARLQRTEAAGHQAGRAPGRAQNAGGGGITHVTMNISTPDVQSFKASESQIAARMARLAAKGNRVL